MQKRSKKRLIRLPRRVAGSVFILVGLVACQHPAGITPMKCPTIPQPRAVEAAPAQPPSEVATALAPGHWEWTDDHYDWISPSWLPRPPHPHWQTAPTLWQNGYWTPDAGACDWTAGRFVS